MIERMETKQEYIPPIACEHEWVQVGTCEWIVNKVGRSQKVYGCAKCTEIKESDVELIYGM